MLVKGEQALHYRFGVEKAYIELSSDPEELVDLYDSTDPDVLALWAELMPYVLAFNSKYPSLAATDAGP